MSYYLTADDGGTLWHTEHGDDEPVPLAFKRSTYDETWTLLLRGAGLDGETVRVSREDLAEVLWHAGPMPAHASEAAIRMWGSRGDDWRGSLTSCPDREATR